MVSAASIAVAGLCAAGCLFTLQRGVWLGAVVATLLTLAVFREVRRFLLPAVTGLAILVIGAFALISGLQSHAGQRASDQQSLWDRYNLNAAALQAAEANPVAGLGWGRFSSDGAPYFQQNPNYPLTAVGDQACTEAGFLSARNNGDAAPVCTQVVHNAYLSTAAELGLIGALLWVLSLVLPIGGAIIRPSGGAFNPGGSASWPSPPCGRSWSFCTPLEGPFSPMVLWAWAGIVWHASSRRRHASQAKSA